MKSFHTSESRASDALLDGSLSEIDHEDAELSDEALRLARIDEYQRNAIHEEEDDLVASLGAATGGLLKILEHYEKATLKLLDDTSGAAHDPPELRQSVSFVLNLSRQAERNVNLITQLTEARRQGANIKSQRLQGVVPGAITQPTRRKSR